jgi:hypothetical protein
MASNASDRWLACGWIRTSGQDERASAEVGRHVSAVWANVRVAVRASMKAIVYALVDLKIVITNR